MTIIKDSAHIRIGEADLYCEVSGSGPTIMLVPGAGGDAGQYDTLTNALAPHHRVIAYDRRGNSRSTTLEGKAATTVEEQADDALALLASLGIRDATVFGNSTGALIALAMGLRSTGSVGRLVLHEPTLLGIVGDPNAALADVQPVIAAGMQQGGFAGGTEAFLRFAAGDAYELIPDAARERILGNGRVLFEAEFGAFSSWVPDADKLASLASRAVVLSAETTAPAFREAAEWLAERVGTTVHVVPGGHMGFLDDPVAFAALIAAPIAA